MATLEELIQRNREETALKKAQPDESNVDPELLEFKELIELNRRESVENPAEAALESGEWTSKDSLMGASLFIEGMTLGWSDEMLTGVASAAQSFASDEDYSAVYKRNKAAYEAETAAFKQRQPGAAMAAEVAGAIVSPLAKIKTASTLTGLALRGATEGGIYAAGAAGQDKTAAQVVVEAAKGASVGGVFGGAVGAGGWLFKRKVAEDLVDEAGKFTPLTIATADKTTPSEAFVQSLYRDIVGPSYGGKGVIRKQEEASTKVITLKNVIDRTKEEVAEAKINLNKAQDSLAAQSTVSKRKIKDDLVLEESVINGDYRPLLGSKGLIINQSTAKIKNSIDNNNDAFRIQAFNDSLPVNIPKDKLKEILEAPNPNAAMGRLEKAWSEVGFQSTKKRSYKLKVDDLVTGINKEIADDTRLQLLAQNKSEISRVINNSLEILSTKINPKTGVIQGSDFTDIRSSLGTAAAAAPETSEGILQSMLYRKVQNVLDDKMESQLSGASREAFKKDRAAWRTHVILKDAVQGASGKAGVNGRFTPNDWVASIKRNSKINARQGEGPLRNQAETISKLNESSAEKIKAAATRLQGWAEKTRDTGITQARLRSNSELAKLETETASLKRRLSVDKTAPGKLAEAAKKKVAAEESLQKANEAQKEMDLARTPKSPGWFHSYAATGTLGAVVGGALLGPVGLVSGALAGMGTGLAAGQALATPGVQKAIAGQLPAQMAVQNAARSPLGSQALGMVPAAPRVLTGMLTGEQ
tara:strand:- start:42 stop:2315 length:2274 start_codon:yes stop_codon:yes gene_type:complete